MINCLIFGSLTLYRQYNVLDRNIIELELFYLYLNYLIASLRFNHLNKDHFLNQRGRSCVGFDRHCLMTTEHLN